ncbi:hypothetical protein SAMN05877753_104111 [Bacillus oleivorans]|uniref:Uncharacterized protein n=1 Tax=Bacillus oleivorans TaxID=1448271 RepID=A0A285CTZ3_9BACI|nr:CBO0543 family protein [Bacillus oleivorans]SNX70423.1 hypothetical protein SAMN05877753_104111 [Bacillus oleivorans]
MHLIFNFLFLLAAIKWGDWKNWRDYYPTILFFWVGDLLKSYLLYNHWLWTYQETIFAENILRNHTIISLMIMFIVYPSTLLIYLGHFPQAKLRQAGWVLFWVMLYSSIEYMNLHYLHLIRHFNGWNIIWSIIFNMIMFTILRVHYKKPIWAWGLSVIWIIFLLNVFDVPVDKMK